MSVDVESEEVNGGVELELETLRAIYVNELEVEYDEMHVPNLLTVQLHPATAGNMEEKYVRMTLILKLLPEYPESLPEIEIKNPRGLSDEKLSRVKRDLFSVAEGRRGGPMLFEIIETAKEHLTTDNRPCGICAICLYGFSETDVFIKTECYHYFHSHCLSRYVKQFLSKDDEVEMPAKTSGESSSSDQEVICPICRLPISSPDLEKDYPPPSAFEDNFTVTVELLEWQKKMKVLYQKQLAQGGIIDVEAEKNKYLLEISNVPTQSTAVVEVTVDNDENVGKEASSSVSCNIKQVNGKSSLGQKNSNYSNNFRKPNIKPPYREKYTESKQKWHSRSNEFKAHQKSSESFDPSSEKNNVSKAQSEKELVSDSIVNSSNHSDVKINHSENGEPVAQEELDSADKDFSSFERKSSKNGYNSENSNRTPYRGFPRKNSNNQNRWYDKPKYNNKFYPNNSRFENRHDFRESSHYSGPNRNMSSRYHSNYNESYRYNERSRFPVNRDSSYGYQDFRDSSKFQNCQSKPSVRNSSESIKQSNYQGNYRRQYPSTQNNYSEKRNTRPSYTQKRSNVNNVEKNQFSNSSKCVENVQNEKNGISESSLESNVDKACAKENLLSKISSSEVLDEPKMCCPPPPGFANPSKKVIYGLPSINPPPGFRQS